MKHRFILYRRKRGGVFYLEDTTSKKQESLHTKNRAEALTLLHSKNEAHRQPILNRQIARTYLSAADPAIARRTWQTVLDEIIRTKTGENQIRWQVMAKSKVSVSATPHRGERRRLINCEECQAGFC